MTKRMLIAIICIAVALGMSLFSVIHISSKTKELVRELEKAEEAYSEGEDMNEYIKDALDLWKEERRRFTIMLKHEDADDLERWFIKIEDYMSTENTEELFLAVVECKAALEVMLDGEIPKSENIF